MDWMLLIWIVLMLIGFIGSAMYSGLETGSYSLNRIRLQIYNHEKITRAISLKHLIERSTTLLSTLLIGNNIANYLGTASLAVILQRFALEDWQAILLNTAVVTPILFVFGETLPKDLFAAHADRWMYRLSWVLVWSKRVFTLLGIVPLIAGFTWIVMTLLGQSGQVTTFHPRRQVETLVREGVGYGLLTDDQSAMVQRILALSQQNVKEDMTPWRQVEKIRLQDDSGLLWKLADRSRHSRFPVMDSSNKIVGVVNVMDALVHDPDDTPSISTLMQPLVTVTTSMTTRAALDKLRHESAHLAVVMDRAERPVGVVTVKDLVEPITGELSSW